MPMCIICDEVDETKRQKAIRFVEELDKIQKRLGLAPKMNFPIGLRRYLLWAAYRTINQGEG